MRALGGRNQRSGNNSPRFRGNSKRRSLCQHHVDPRPFDPSRPTSAQGQAKERAAGALRRHQLWPLRRLHRGYDEAEVDRLAVLPKLSMLPSSEGAKSVPKATSSSQPLHQPAASPFVLLGGTMPRRDGGPRALILPWRAIRARSETTLARCPAPSSRARGFIGHPLAVERAADQLCPNRLATIVDAGSARLLAVGKRLQQIA